MFKRMKYKISLVILLLLFLPLNVMAKENIKLSVDKTDLTVGDEIVVSASVPEGLDSYALIATLKYDNNVFQKIGESDFLASESETIIMP